MEPNAFSSASHRMIGVAQHLAKSNAYDPGIEKILEVTETLDAIYQRAARA
jgi:hypothetical protein